MAFSKDIAHLFNCYIIVDIALDKLLTIPQPHGQGIGRHLPVIKEPYLVTPDLIELPLEVDIEESESTAY